MSLTFDDRHVYKIREGRLALFVATPLPSIVLLELKDTGGRFGVDRVTGRYNTVGESPFDVVAQFPLPTATPDDPSHELRAAELGHEAPEAPTTADRFVDRDGAGWLPNGPAARGHAIKKFISEIPRYPGLVVCGEAYDAAVLRGDTLERELAAAKALLGQCTDSTFQFGRYEARRWRVGWILVDTIVSGPDLGHFPDVLAAYMRAQEIITAKELAAGKAGVA
jgi:hypothetical protein